MILVIKASARKNGQSNSFIDGLIEGLEDEVKVYDLNNMNLKGCSGCGACKKGADICVIKDDLKVFFEDLKRADHLIYGSPNYMGTINGQMKMVYDRHFCLTDGDKQHKISHLKKCLLVIAQGYSDPDYYKTAYDQVRGGLAHLLNTDLDLHVACQSQGLDQELIKTYQDHFNQDR